MADTFLGYAYGTDNVRMAQYERPDGTRYYGPTGPDGKSVPQPAPAPPPAPAPSPQTVVAAKPTNTFSKDELDAISQLVNVGVEPEKARDLVRTLGWQGAIEAMGQGDAGGDTPAPEDLYTNSGITEGDGLWFGMQKGGDEWRPSGGTMSPGGPGFDMGSGDVPFGPGFDQGAPTDPGDPLNLPSGGGVYVPPGGIDPVTGNPSGPSTIIGPPTNYLQAVQDPVHGLIYQNPDGTWKDSSGRQVTPNDTEFGRNPTGENPFLDPRFQRPIGPADDPASLPPTDPGQGSFSPVPGGPGWGKPANGPSELPPSELPDPLQPSDPGDWTDTGRRMGNNDGQFVEFVDPVTGQTEWRLVGPPPGPPTGTPDPGPSPDPGPVTDPGPGTGPGPGDPGPPTGPPTGPPAVVPVEPPVEPVVPVEPPVEPVTPPEDPPPAEPPVEPPVEPPPVLPVEPEPPDTEPEPPPVIVDPPEPPPSDPPTNPPEDPGAGGGPPGGGGDPPGGGGDPPFDPGVPGVPYVPPVVPDVGPTQRYGPSDLVVNQLGVPGATGGISTSNSWGDWQGDPRLAAPGGLANMQAQYDHWKNLQAKPPMKKGGTFNVDGEGGTDSQTVAFKATPGEIVGVLPNNGKAMENKNYKTLLKAVLDQAHNQEGGIEEIIAALLERDKEELPGFATGGVAEVSPNPFLPGGVAQPDNSGLGTIPNTINNAKNALYTQGLDPQKVGGMDPGDLQSKVTSGLGLGAAQTQETFNSELPGALGGIKGLYNTAAQGLNAPIDKPSAGSATDYGAGDFYQGGQEGMTRMNQTMGMLDQIGVPQNRQADSQNAFAMEEADKQNRERIALQEMLASRGISNSSIADDQLAQQQKQQAIAMASANMNYNNAIGNEERANAQLGMNKVDQYGNLIGQTEGMDLNRRAGELQRGQMNEASQQRVIGNQQANATLEDQIKASRMNTAMAPMSAYLSTLRGTNVSPGAIPGMQSPQQNAGWGEILGNVAGNAAQAIPFLL